MKFVKFTENNDWEGETWNFWLQLDGNEVELKKLEAFVKPLEEGEPVPYELDMTPVDESEVDTLVKHSGGSYMNDHNKITGTFKMPEFDGELVNSDELYEFANDNFYKGDIERHFSGE